MEKPTARKQLGLLQRGWEIGGGEGQEGQYRRRKKSTGLYSQGDRQECLSLATAGRSARGRGRQYRPGACTLRDRGKRCHAKQSKSTGLPANRSGRLEAGAGGRQDAGATWGRKKEDRQECLSLPDAVAVCAFTRNAPGFPPASDPFAPGVTRMGAKSRCHITF